MELIAPNASKMLPVALGRLLELGEEVGSRNGRVKELTHLQLALTQPWKRELLVPHRKPNLAAQIAETMWIMAGRNDIGWLSDYLPRAGDFSDDGETWRAGYGPRLRAWADHANARKVDQLAEVVNRLKADPLDRRAVISLWDPVVDTTPGKDIACNNWLSFMSRNGELDLHVAVRSNDAIWGWSGINAFEWSFLQELVAGLLGVHVGSLYFSVASFHLYERHWEKARKIVGLDSLDSLGVWRQASQAEPVRMNPAVFNRDLAEFDELVDEWFTVEHLIRIRHNDHEKAVDEFPEPLLQSWLRVLQWRWTGEREYLAPLEGTRTELATREGMTLQPREPFEPRSTGPHLHFERVEHPARTVDEFVSYVCELHLQKHRAYGDSWKRRGEQLGILANVARKVDRLGGTETPDETAADTALDLLVYLAKYHTWLEDGLVPVQAPRADDPEVANRLIARLALNRAETAVSNADLERKLTTYFEEIARLATLAPSDYWGRAQHVTKVLPFAYELAYRLWAGVGPAEHDGDDYRGADVD